MEDKYKYYSLSLVTGEITGHVNSDYFKAHVGVGLEKGMTDGRVYNGTHLASKVDSCFVANETKLTYAGLTKGDIHKDAASKIIFIDIEKECDEMLIHQKIQYLNEQLVLMRKYNYQLYAENKKLREELPKSDTIEPVIEVIIQSRLDDVPDDPKWTIPDHLLDDGYYSERRAAS